MNAIFLDRDGTIIVDPPDERVDSKEKVKLFPDTIEALRKLGELNYSIIFITNQAGIGEGRISDREFWEIHEAVLQQLAPSGVHILKTYMCPHRAEDNCTCRKPKPTMLLRAAKEFGINVSRSWFIGDRTTDIAAGKAAGVQTILVQTANKPQASDGAVFVAPHLLDAVQFIAKI